ncbi:MAG: fumarate hydratase [Erysipelotrichaceae bacterium]|nr:fumarate hydratase [Erysipelotrichaceae bacterium]MDD3809415.1 fumarate hydratase [Erysipelotrichaceae bacterium]
MREIRCQDITATIAKLAQKAAVELPEDVSIALDRAIAAEDFPLAQETLKTIKHNNEIARTTCKPICQDTGMANVYITIGQEVAITGGSLKDAINKGVAQGYQDGYLRKSVVDDPLFDRKNTQDNTPALIYIDLVEGDEFKIVFAPKGFGSENMSKIKMLKPSEGVAGVRQFVEEVVTTASSNPCPPIVVGVGIGGSFDKVAYLAKQAMLRKIGSHHPDGRYAALEDELLEIVNATGIGPAGLGGKTTALGLNIETMPTHIAGLPVAVAICCHVSRHMEASL